MSNATARVGAPTTYPCVRCDFLLGLDGVDVERDERGATMLTATVSTPGQPAYQKNWSRMFAASLIAIMPAVTPFARIERHLVGGMTAGAIKWRPCGWPATLRCAWLRVTFEEA